MKTSEILITAKAHLFPSKGNASHPISSYICNAINLATDAYSDAGSVEHDRYAVQRKILLNLIRERLEGIPTLEVWLAKKHGIKCLDIWSHDAETVNAYCSKVQSTRHAWIDSLIADFQAMGD